MTMFKLQCDTPKAQRGNVLFLILIAIILFGALSFAVGNMFRGGSVETISEEKGKIITTDLIDYTRSIRQAIQAMRIDGCDETEISFEKSPFDGSDTDYVNLDSPSNFSCHVFHPNGGGINYQIANEDVGPNRDWFFGINRVGRLDGSQNIGTPAGDLVAMLLEINTSVCDLINDSLNGFEVFESGGLHNGSSVNRTEFVGDYTSTRSINRGNNTTPEAGCFCDGSGSVGCPASASHPRFFYYTLLKR